MRPLKANASTAYSHFVKLNVLLVPIQHNSFVPLKTFIFVKKKKNNSPKGNMPTR